MPKAIIAGKSGGVAGIRTKEKKGPIRTPTTKNAEIKAEKEKGLRKKSVVFTARNAAGWSGKATGGTYLTGTDSGALGWLVPALCKFFKVADVGYKRQFKQWNFPPAIDDPKGKLKHVVARKFYKQVDGKYLLVDVLDGETSIAKINLIKAWLEALGFAYTYVLGDDDYGADKDYLKLLFVDRLKPLDPKDKNYPKFKIPLTYADAGMPYK